MDIRGACKLPHHLAEDLQPRVVEEAPGLQHRRLLRLRRLLPSCSLLSIGSLDDDGDLMEGPVEAAVRLWPRTRSTSPDSMPRVLRSCSRGSGAADAEVPPSLGFRV